MKSSLTVLQDIPGDTDAPGHRGHDHPRLPLVHGLQSGKNRKSREPSSETCTVSVSLRNGEKGQLTSDLVQNEARTLSAGFVSSFKASDSCLSRLQRECYILLLWSCRSSW